MATTNQYSKLFQVLSEVLDTCTVPEVIGALNTLRGMPVASQPAPLSKKRQKAHFANLILNGIRAGKPEHLKKKKTK